MRRRRTQSLRPCPVRQRCRDHQWVRWIRGLRIRETRWRGFGGALPGEVSVGSAVAVGLAGSPRLRGPPKAAFRRCPPCLAVNKQSNSSAKRHPQTMPGVMMTTTMPLLRALPAETKPVITLQQEDVTTGEEGGCLFTPTERCTSSSPRAKAPSWKEQGRGEMRLNRGKDGGARMVMRAEGELAYPQGHVEGTDLHQDGGWQGAHVSLQERRERTGCEGDTFALKMRVSATRGAAGR